MTFQRRLLRIPRDRQNAPALDEIGVVVKERCFLIYFLIYCKLSFTNIFKGERHKKYFLCNSREKRTYHITKHLVFCSGQVITAKVQETTARFGVRSQAQALDLLYGCTPFYHLSRRGSGVGTHNS